MESGYIEKKIYHESKCWRYVRENIKYFRGLKGWTQLDLAEKIGCGDGKIKGLEQGTIKFTQVSLDEICRVFDISIDLLFVSREHYLTRVSSYDYARVKNATPKLYSVLKSIIQDFSYLLGIVNTYNYNQHSMRICYEMAELLNITNATLNQHKVLLTKILKAQVEKEVISLASEDLFKEKRSSYLTYDALQDKIPPLYKFFSDIMESNSPRISSILRIPIYVKDTRDILGCVWICFSGGKRIKDAKLNSHEREINKAIWRL